MSATERIRQKMGETLGHGIDRLGEDVELTDLVNNSFLLVELVIELQEEFGVRFEQADMNGVRTVGDLVGLVAGRMDANGDG